MRGGASCLMVRAVVPVVVFTSVAVTVSSAGPKATPASGSFPNQRWEVGESVRATCCVPTLATTATTGYLDVTLAATDTVSPIVALSRGANIVTATSGFPTSDVAVNTTGGRPAMVAVAD